MTKSVQYILVGLVAIVIIALLTRYVFFKEQFEEWGRGLERIGSWQEQYKQDHPNATKPEMDAAFSVGIKGLEQWQTEYKKTHPNATKAEMDAAFTAAW